MIHVMLPVQYLRQAGAHLMEPHRRVMLAVLQTVVDDCRGRPYQRSAGYGARVDGRAYRQATAYMARTDRVWPFSFENLCGALGLDAGCLRQALQKETGA